MSISWHCQGSIPSLHPGPLEHAHPKFGSTLREISNGSQRSTSFVDGPTKARPLLTTNLCNWLSHREALRELGKSREKANCTVAARFDSEEPRQFTRLILYPRRMNLFPDPSWPLVALSSVRSQRDVTAENVFEDLEHVVRYGLGRWKSRENISTAQESVRTGGPAPSGRSGSVYGSIERRQFFVVHERPLVRPRAPRFHCRPPAASLYTHPLTFPAMSTSLKSHPAIVPTGAVLAAEIARSMIAGAAANPVRPATRVARPVENGRDVFPRDWQ